ncbi:hypothetical protein [uncultured Mediterranean phage uvMED]|nr:hypothetical protein [uncultured Mediterranean phage uvMED]
MPIVRNVGGTTDDNQHPFDDLESTKSVSSTRAPRLEQVNSSSGANLSNAQGFIGYVTDYYRFDGSNPVQQLEAETFTDLNPSIQQLFDERTDAMKAGSTDGYLPASHGEHGHSTHGANHFSLAGLENGSFCTVRILYKLTPEIDESSSQVRLHFSTNSATQANGLTEFTIESQSLVMSEGANQDYSDENLISFFIGDTLSGDTEEEAGSFHVSVKSSVEADLEILGVTLYANV